MRPRRQDVLAPRLQHAEVTPLHIGFPQLAIDAKLLLLILFFLCTVINYYFLPRQMNLPKMPF